MGYDIYPAASLLYVTRMATSAPFYQERLSELRRAREAVASLPSDFGGSDVTRVMIRQDETEGRQIKPVHARVRTSRCLHRLADKGELIKVGTRRWHKTGRAWRWHEIERHLRGTGSAIEAGQAKVDALPLPPVGPHLDVRVVFIWKTPVPRHLAFLRDLRRDSAERRHHPLLRPEWGGRKPLSVDQRDEFDDVTRRMGALLQKNPDLGRNLLGTLIPWVIGRTPGVLVAYPVAYPVRGRRRTRGFILRLKWQKLGQWTIKQKRAIEGAWRAVRPVQERGEDLGRVAEDPRVKPYLALLSAWSYPNVPELPWLPSARRSRSQPNHVHP